MNKSKQVISLILLSNRDGFDMMHVNVEAEREGNVVRSMYPMFFLRSQ